MAEKLRAVTDAQELESIRVEFLGKKGSVTDLLKGMKALSGEEKKSFGQLVNELKNEISDAITVKVTELQKAALEHEINSAPEICGIVGESYIVIGGRWK